MKKPRISLEDLIKTRDQKFSIKEFLIRIENNFPKGFSTSELTEFIQKNYRTIKDNKELSPKPGYYEHIFNRNYSYVLIKGLLSSDLIYRKLSNNMKGTRKRYNYFVNNENLDKDIHPSDAEKLLQAYINFKGYGVIDKTISEDKEFYDFMKSLEKVDSKSYKKCGGHYLNKILEAKK